MRRVELSEVEGVRVVPEAPRGVGAVVLSGSSGRVESARAELLARHGVVAESFRWFGGAGQHDGPWDIPLELMIGRVDDLARECDRVLVLGTSFGAEAALLVGALHDRVAGVVAFAPSDVVWAGVRSDGSMTSHWTLGGEPLPYVPFDETWQPESDPPAYVGMYAASRARFADRLAAATIPVERIPELLLVAGGDDQVWSATTMADAIRARRSGAGLDTVIVSVQDAGHHAILPGEPAPAGGARMRRGGSEEAGRRLGAAAWERILTML